jgi:hypothetical protein
MPCIWSNAARADARAGAGARADTRAARRSLNERHSRSRWRGAPLTVKVVGSFGACGVAAARSSGGEAPPPPSGALSRSSAQFIDGAASWSASLHA